MRIAKYNSLGLDWEFDVPSTVEENDTLAKKGGATLESAIDHIVFHSTLGEIREVFTELVEAELKAKGTPVGRESGRKDEDGDDILLNDAAYFTKVQAATNTSPKDWAYLQPKVLEKVKYDPSVKERKPPQPKKIPATVLTSAKELIGSHGQQKTLPNGAVKTVDVNVIVSKLLSLNKGAPEMVLDQATNLPTVESLAKLIQLNEARKRAEQKLTQLVLVECAE